MGELILGTAQLGQRYGIANHTGQPDTATAHAIVRAAWEHGICAFDTAPEYGDAEAWLGDTFAAIGIAADVRVVTKLASDVDPDDLDAVVENVERSRTRLGVPRLDGLLVRRTLLPRWNTVHRAFGSLRDQGVVERVGVSVYTPDEALQALTLDGVTFIQVPTNMLDRRFLAAGVFDRAQALGKRIVVRSVFLQGLLTMRPEEAPPIPGAREALEGLRRASDALGGMTPIALAIAYVRERCLDADVLIGAEASQQVAGFAACWARGALKCADVIERYVPAGTSDLVDPTRWPARQFN